MLCAALTPRLGLMSRVWIMELVALRTLMLLSGGLGFRVQDLGFRA